MPYDYYEYLKKLRDSDEYNQIDDVVRQNIWNDSIDFNTSLNWQETEDKIRIRLYILLRYN